MVKWECLNCYYATYSRRTKTINCLFHHGNTVTKPVECCQFYKPVPFKMLMPSIRNLRKRRLPIKILQNKKEEVVEGRCPKCGSPRLRRRALQLSSQRIIVYQCKCGNTFTFMEQAPESLKPKMPPKTLAEKLGFKYGES